jgi:hypothetical protein
LAGIWKLKRLGVYVYFGMFFLPYLLIVIELMLDITFKTGAWYSLLLIFPIITYRWGLLNIVLLIAVTRKWSLFSLSLALALAAISGLARAIRYHVRLQAIPG